jgi:DNA-binding PadR family transcriptional regulator
MDNQKRILKQLKMGTTEVLILAVLSRKDQYGYELARKVHRSSGGYFDLKQGFLYPALRRMEQAKLLRSYQQDSDSHGPDRKYYHLTPKGKAFLTTSLEAWKEFSCKFNRTLSGIRKGPAGGTAQ